jgi:ABC-type Zn uptake system ZnuABC Zn-binding protein ZnuA
MSSERNDAGAETKRELSALMEQLDTLSEDEVKDLQKALSEQLVKLGGLQQTESQQSTHSIIPKSKLSTTEQLNSKHEVKDIEKALHEVLESMRQNLEKLIHISNLHAAKIRQADRTPSPSGR